MGLAIPAGWVPENCQCCIVPQQRLRKWYAARIPWKHGWRNRSSSSGFTTLSVLAALNMHWTPRTHAQDGQMVNAVQARLFTDAADDVRRVCCINLQQVSLKEPRQISWLRWMHCSGSTSPFG